MISNWMNKFKSCVFLSPLQVLVVEKTELVESQYLRARSFISVVA